MNTKNYTLIFFLILGLATSTSAQDLFTPVAPNYNNQSVIIPPGFKYKVLFSEGDTVVTNDRKHAPAKGSQDMIIYIPIKHSSKHGYLYVNHEEHIPNAVLGDGGGGTVFEIQQVNNEWKVIGDFHAIDFSSVGQTFRNCGGTLTPKGTVLTTEEEFPLSNEEIFSVFGITDTTPLNYKPRYLNYGWMIEVDPNTHKALNRVVNFGRFRHEDAQCMPDEKTVFITCDDQPSVLFKYVAAHKNDYYNGKLYAYRQSADGAGGDWVALPMEQDSLADAMNVALRRGATMMISTEWVEAVGDKLYISESGTDSVNFENEVAMGAKPAKHLRELCAAGGNSFRDPYGRILMLDLKTNKLSVVVNGGVNPSDSMMCFSSPDATTSATINGKKYLIVSEDTQGNKNGRASTEVSGRGETYNEVYFLDLADKNPGLASLKRFMVAPEGCETSGDMFTPDGKTYFVSIQHPSTTNPAPFNKSCVIAVTGF